MAVETLVQETQRAQYSIRTEMVPKTIPNPRSGNIWYTRRQSDRLTASYRVGTNQICLTGLKEA
jgi:hypothetical protein